MQEKLRTGAGKEINKYMILGACNPHGAYQAVKIEEHIGVMLPCNFIVRETNNGEVEVAAINPEKTIFDRYDFVILRSYAHGGFCSWAMPINKS